MRWREKIGDRAREVGLLAPPSDDELSIIKRRSTFDADESVSPESMRASFGLAPSDRFCLRRWHLNRGRHRLHSPASLVEEMFCFEPPHAIDANEHATRDEENATGKRFMGDTSFWLKL
jgi:hypothetical protein